MNEDKPVAWVHILYGDLENAFINTNPPEEYDRYHDHVPLYPRPSEAMQDRYKGTWIDQRYDRDTVMNAHNTKGEEE